MGVSQVDCVVLEKNLAKQALFKLKDIDIYSVNYPQDYRRMFHFNFNLLSFSLKDTLKMMGILFLCTLIGKGFMHKNSTQYCMIAFRNLSSLINNSRIIFRSR